MITTSLNGHGCPLRERMTTAAPTPVSAPCLFAPAPGNSQTVSRNGLHSCCELHDEFVNISEYDQANDNDPCALVQQATEHPAAENEPPSTRSSSRLTVREPGFRRNCINNPCAGTFLVTRSAFENEAHLQSGKCGFRVGPVQARHTVSRNFRSSM